MKAVRKERQGPLFVGLLQQKQQIKAKTQGLPFIRCRRRTTPQFSRINPFLKKNEPEINIPARLFDYSSRTK
jgi:hypothetical protein